eukprot:CAMPEP_0117014662 /NCGR_PEP_ID=MMETSP0472-20121206/11852_1 /TAXON_ID=693140 ORGANISM="Tiarina fusus, Strain LIS" /NCGR_SAMPLE_ID=MMETSP0472 /ASSEMBLY_ACC=CAM_ASM_000603 /LENGTH=183 /DNA_ID=CAMNT_0004718275 /DNA_START=277 /DNA_END=825 /DNA_ORIENTATION=+
MTVRANQVYNEYIQDRNHVHMNSTSWQTLTEFVYHLGRAGKISVEETPKGLYIRYIDREELARQEERMKRKKTILDEEERANKQIAKQKRRAALLEGNIANPSESTPLSRDPDQKVAFSLGKATTGNTKPKSALFLDDDEESENETKQEPSEEEVTGKKRSLDEIIDQNVKKTSSDESPEPPT